MDLNHPIVMGIVNVTPDSFYDGGKLNTRVEILNQTGRMLKEGATIIDLGAYSSRPKAEHIAVEEEIKRLIPALRSIVKEYPEAIISVDTFRADIAQMAIAEGAHIINDISGGNIDHRMFSTIAKLKVPYVLMHMKGTPQTMTGESNYEDVFEEVFQYFLAKIKLLNELGIVDLIIDPGFGFAKTASQSYQLLARLDQFKLIGLPVLAGLSRKSMICKAIDTTPEFALNGTTVANTIALIKGAKILRVHDVKAAVEAINIVGKIE